MDGVERHRSDHKTQYEMCPRTSMANNLHRLHDSDTWSWSLKMDSYFEYCNFSSGMKKVTETQTYSFEAVCTPIPSISFKIPIAQRNVAVIRATASAMHSLPPIACTSTTRGKVTYSSLCIPRGYNASKCLCLPYGTPLKQAGGKHLRCSVSMGLCGQCLCKNKRRRGRGEKHPQNFGLAIYMGNSCHYRMLLGVMQAMKKALKPFSLFRPRASWAHAGAALLPLNRECSITPILGILPASSSRNHFYSWRKHKAKPI